jgi:hypothetical protein
MLLPDRGEDDGDPPGLVGPVDPRLPSIRDGEPPMPPRTQKYVPPPPVSVRTVPTDALTSVWMRLAMLVAMIVYAVAADAKDAPPEWMLALVSVAIGIIPDKVLNALIPPPLRRWVAGRPRRALLGSAKLVTIQTDAGDTWITHVPSIPVSHAGPEPVRWPFRVMSGLIALLCMIVAMIAPGEIPLLARLVGFAVGAVFGGIALVPDGDVTRMLPRISTGPRLPPAGGAARLDAD